jgi:ATP-binding cassette, subfamily C, bacterial CydD
MSSRRDTKSISTHQRILRYSRSASIWLTLAIAAGFCATVIVVAQAYVLSDVVDRVFQKKQTLAGVAPLLGLLLALACVRALIIGCSDVLAQRSASQLKGSLRRKLTQQIFALGPAYTQRESSGELVNATVEGVEVLDEYITAYQPARLLAVLVPVFVLVVIFLLDPPTTLILLFTGPILVLLLAFIGGRTKDITEKRFLELGWMSAFFLDMLQGLATLKMFGRSREQIDSIREISQHYGRTTMEVLGTAFQTSLVLEWGGTVATALVAVEVSLRLMSGLLPFNYALAVLIITPEFFLPLRQLAIKYHAGTAGKAAADRIFSILDIPIKQARTQTTRSLMPARSDIRFEHVFFAYDNGRRPALQDFSLHIPHGQTIALVGATGAGKSTAAQLLLRFIEPDRGSIRVGSVSLDEIARSAWRARVAWVPQQPHLFHGTIADNIRLARADAGEADVIGAAQAAHAHDFIMQLPWGYATPIGERGARLSGGQQQRLAIARAFLKDAPILILDEATSHLDSVSEAAIQDALDRLMRGRTVLIIAHRLRLVHTADQVAVLDQGYVLEVGEPRALLTQSGPYHQIVTSYEGAA